jgi:hypothetical protein
MLQIKTSSNPVLQHACFWPPLHFPLPPDPPPGAGSVSVGSRSSRGTAETARAIARIEKIMNVFILMLNEDEFGSCEE